MKRKHFINVRLLLFERIVSNTGKYKDENNVKGITLFTIVHWHFIG